MFHNSKSVAANTNSKTDNIILIHESFNLYKHVGNGFFILSGFIRRHVTPRMFSPKTTYERIIIISITFVEINFFLNTYGIA